MPPAITSLGGGAQLDIVNVSPNGGILGTGPVAQRLIAGGMNVSALRTATVLRKEEWLLFDQAVIEVAKERLVAVADLFAAGLTFGITNPLGTLRVEWEQLSDIEPAELSMSGVTPGQRDRPVYTPVSVPLPIAHKDFQINIRALEASRNLGESLDTTSARLATRRVTELLEKLVFDGDTLISGGAQIFGYTTATNRNTGSLPIDWALVTATGELIVTDVINMIGASVGDNYFGPWMLYIPRTYDDKLREDYKANSDLTIRQRILEIEGINGIRMSTNLPDGGTGEVVLVNMTSDVVDIVDGMQPTTVMWETEGGMIVHFKVMAIMVPRVKNDSDLQSGIVHFSV